MKEEQFKEATRISDEISSIDADLRSADAIKVKMECSNRVHGIMIQYDVESIFLTKEESLDVLKKICEMKLSVRQKLIKAFDSL